MVVLVLNRFDYDASGDNGVVNISFLGGALDVYVHLFQSQFKICAYPIKYKISNSTTDIEMITLWH